MSRLLGCVLGVVAVAPVAVACGTDQIVLDDACSGQAIIVEPAVIELAVSDSIQVSAGLNRSNPCVPHEPTIVTWRAEPAGLLGLRRVNDSMVVATALMAGDPVIVAALVSDSRLRGGVGVKIR